MGKTNLQRWTVCLASTVLVSGLYSLAPLWASPTPPVTVQFIARGLRASAPSAGHIFMLVTVQTETGPAREGYGFYPKSLLTIIKGPGMLKSEYRCSGTEDCNATQTQLEKWSKDPDSTTVTITMSQLHTIEHDINKFNESKYRLTQNNCMDFVGTVVNDLGYPSPKRSPSQLPTDYLHELHLGISQELAARAEREQLEAERKAQQEAERKRIEEERKPDISGHWTDHRDGFTVSLEGTIIHFDGHAKFGQGKGYFTSKTTFAMSWPPPNGGHTARINGNAEIIWDNAVHWYKK